MKKKENDRPDGERRLPHIGLRIIKTSVAVFLCLLVYCLRGYRGQEMPTEAVITAIICMQPYVRDTRDYAVNRFAGTLIGVFWGLALLLLLLLFPVLGKSLPLLYALMALGVCVSLYSAVLLRRPDASSLAAIVFICMVISFPEIEDPLRQTVTRFLGVLLGTAVAIGVNIFRLPRTKDRESVFFVRTKDFVPDRFSHLPPAVLFRLNYLYDDGAKICLMSEHAPAFFTLQMHGTHLSVPLIVMDGAAIYDANENAYLHVETIDPAESARLREHLEVRKLSYFIYTVHRGRTCIFHQGPMTAPEKVVYERMRRSPYRSYLEGESWAPEEIVYFKIIGENAMIAELGERLRAFLPQRGLRVAVRPQAGAPGIAGLYIYTAQATMAHAEETLMALLREEDPALRAVEIFAKSPYRSEHDAMVLLRRLVDACEPVRFFRRKNRKP